MNHKKILIKTNLAVDVVEKKDCVKIRYATREEAKDWAQKHSQKYSKTQRLYYCNRCDGFHLTTKTPKEMEVINTMHDRRIEKVADYWAKKLQIKD